MEFPTYAYKSPGHFECQGGTYTFATANDAEQLAVLHEAGWFDSIPEALAGKAKEVPVPEDDAPVTRPELEAKASELGLPTKGVSSSKLSASIAKRLG